MTPYGISIIICVHNGSKRIVYTLKAIARQNLPSDLPCELVIVDNASTDKTAEIAASYLKSISFPIPFSIVNEPKPGKSNALITGYDKAKYELMLLCDDDNWLQPDYLKTASEIYSKHPEIGLLGGYGKALFEQGKKPEWFDKYENYYVCGKHHKSNGFLKPLDYSIWGAGSVLRKKMWEYLRSNGFNFYHSVDSGKAIGEDVELAIAITFTGHRLYFDDRLWFTHDLRGGRVTWKNLLRQEALNGKTIAALRIYKFAYKNSSGSYKTPFILLFAKQLLFFCFGFFFNLVIKRGDIVFMTNYLNTIKELAFHYRKYKKLFEVSSIWIRHIKDTFPLTSANTNLYQSANDE